MFCGFLFLRILEFGDFWSPFFLVAFAFADTFLGGLLFALLPLLKINSALFQASALFNKKLFIKTLFYCLKTPLKPSFKKRKIFCRLIKQSDRKYKSQFTKRKTG